MAAPPVHQPIIDAPDPQKLRNKGWLYKFTHDVWQRTGGQKSVIADMSGLEASVDELNTLVGIYKGETVQQQLNKKEDKANLGTMAYQDANNVTIVGGTIRNVGISKSDITIQAGGCQSCDIKLNGTLHMDMTAVGNVGTGEDTLISYTMPANVLYEDLQFLEIIAFGIVAANANNKQIKLKLGATEVFASPVILTTLPDGASWELTSRITRTGSATQKCISKMILNTKLCEACAQYVLASENTTSALNIFCTGEATADNDIVQEGLIVKWYSN